MYLTVKIAGQETAVVYDVGDQAQELGIGIALTPTPPAGVDPQQAAAGPQAAPAAAVGASAGASGVTGGQSSGGQQA